MTQWTRVSDALDRLARELPDVEIATDPMSLASHARDWWMRSLITQRLGELRRPAAVVRAHAVLAIVAWEIPELRRCTTET